MVFGRGRTAIIFPVLRAGQFSIVSQWPVCRWVLYVTNSEAGSPLTSMSSASVAVAPDMSSIRGLANVREYRGQGRSTNLRACCPLPTFSTRDTASHAKRVSPQTHNVRAGIETGIETQYPPRSSLLHYRYMQGVPSRDPDNGRKQCPGRRNCRHAECQHVVSQSVESLNRPVDRIRPSNGCVAVNYLLIDLHVRDKKLPISCQLPQRSDRPILIRMRCTNGAHRYVGVDKNHGASCQGSICRSMTSMSAVGKLYSAAAAMARSFASALPFSFRAWRRDCLTHSAKVIRCMRAMSLISLYSSSSSSTCNRFVMT